MTAHSVADAPLYALIWRDAAYCLVGPFADHDALSDWCMAPQQNPHDDPRWNSIRLADPHKPVRVLSPDSIADDPILLNYALTAQPDVPPPVPDELARELRHTWLTGSSPEYIGSAREFLAMWASVADYVRHLRDLSYTHGYAQGYAAGKGRVVLGNADLDALAAQRACAELPVQAEIEVGEEP